MNFLSHHYIHHHHSNPHFTLGKILPDMLRQFGPQNKLRHAQNHSQPSNEIEWLEKGAFVHLEADRLFHPSEFFKEKTARLKTFLREANLFGKYKFFYAHLLLEMLLDRILVKRHFAIATTLYARLNQVERATIAAFFRYKEMNLDQERFFQNLQRFVESRYLLQYQEDEGLTFALERTVSRVGLPAFSKKDKSILINNLDQLEATVASDYLSIFMKLEKAIPA